MRSEPLGLEPKRVAVQRAEGVDRDLEPFALLAAAPERDGLAVGQDQAGEAEVRPQPLAVAGSAISASRSRPSSSGSPGPSRRTPLAVIGSLAASSLPSAHRSRAWALPIPAHSANCVGVEGP